MFSSPVCLAMKPPDKERPQDWNDYHLLVTPEAQDEVCPSHIWHHLGGWSDEGDTYDTQQSDFEQELNRFWADLVGPDENIRRQLLESLYVVKNWLAVTVHNTGSVDIHFTDGSVKHLASPERALS